MAHALEFYWDFSSPFAYLGSTQVDALAQRTGATLVERPMLLGALFKAVGTVDVPLFAFPEVKRRYMLQDVQRWADYWSVPFRFPTHFPLNSVRALRIFLALSPERRAAYRNAAFEAYWARDEDLNDEAVLRAVVDAVAPGETKAVFERISTPEVKQALFDATQRAIDRGVFGAPTFVVDETALFWGQDRLPLVERALTSPSR
jgi:2-hydroxychromene-2-carboxylate isomerase